MKTSLTFRRAIASFAIVTAAVLGTSAGTAHAAWADCPAGYNCWYSGASGIGTRWQVAGSNKNLGSWGITTRSGYNHGTSGLRVCGYTGIEFLGSMNYSRPMGDTETYSARVINSNRWVTGICS